MKKITLLCFIFITSISQSKSTAIISLNAYKTTKFTLDKATSKVTVVLIGAADKWSSFGIGTSSATTRADVYEYATSMLEITNVSTNSTQDWTTVFNTELYNIHTVTLERALTNSDLKDLQMASDTTNVFDVVWSSSGYAIATAPNPNRGSTTAVFTANFGVEVVSFYDDDILYPNSASSEVLIRSRTNLSNVTILS